MRFAQIKDYRRADKISAGPQSHILEGVSWEEAKKMQVCFALRILDFVRCISLFDGDASFVIDFYLF